VCALEVVRESGVRGVIAQRGLEPVSRRPPLRNESADRDPVTRDDDGLAMLDRIEDVSEAPRCLRGSNCDHEYILSDLVCLCVYEAARAPPRGDGSTLAATAVTMPSVVPSGNFTFAS
jgi:hypothetical protein